MNTADQLLRAKERRAFALFLGIFGGALIAWILAELTVRVTSNPDLLHVAIALVGAFVGMALAHWRVPSGEKGEASDG